MLHTSDRRTVGIRVPDSPIIIEVVRALGRPVISTTAHRPGDEHMVIDARDIEPTFPGVDLVLDGGIGGREPTTVVDLTRETIDIIREGAGPISRLLE
jgi:tRNA A37 threonylcarbamoyladenosine synthetase subunit TsaC/SUA5/YrdC